ncbi:DUF3944 domain-containing protein [Psychrobacter sp. Ps1]|uniref:DUF3944 domain-containing protein n=1 Tax=Gammaproteobacteria TaxID=1236 RepID=UPI001EE07771|nr:DUF3944 domain-containing protein [Psychrobacter sp. Ps1]MCG3842396.1 DUF3944 domain-containing protein [Psychrobacter sp. Ps1]
MAVESKFREDKDLAFLQFADWKDLKILADALIKDSSGTEQWTGQLKKALDKNINMYRTSKEAYENSWKSIAAELQLFGGDTIANLARRKGVLYEELLHDVAGKVNVDFHKGTASIAEVEERVLRILFKRITTLEDISDIYKTLEKKGLLGLTSLESNPWETIKNGLGVGAGTGVAGAGASAIFAGIKMIPKFAKANPIVAAATLPLTVKDFSSPAYRVTVPAVCIIAMMRTKYNDNSSDYDEF